MVGEQEALALGVLEDGGVTEIILLGGLDAEGALGPHAQHCLVDVQRAHVLQLGQADVQCTEGTLRTTTGMLSATQEPSLPLACPAARDHGQGRDSFHSSSWGHAAPVSHGFLGWKCRRGRLDLPPHPKNLHPSSGVTPYLSCQCQHCSAPQLGVPLGDP